MAKADKPSFKLDDRPFEEIFAEWEGISLRKSKLLNQNKGRLPSSRKEEAVSNSRVEVRSMDQILADWEKAESKPSPSAVQSSRSKADVRSMDQILSDWEAMQENTKTPEARPARKASSQDTPVVSKVDIPSMESLFGKSGREEEVEDGAVIFTKKPKDRKQAAKQEKPPVPSSVSVRPMEQILADWEQEQPKGQWIAFIPDAKLELEDASIQKAQSLLSDFLGLCRADDKTRIKIEWQNSDPAFAYKVKKALYGFGIKERNIHLVRSRAGSCRSIWAIDCPVKSKVTKIEVRPMAEVFGEWEANHAHDIQKQEEPESQERLSINALRRMMPMATLDLHEHTGLEAQKAIAEFLDECRKKGFQKLALIVGKGLHSPGEPIMESVARQALAQDGNVREVSKAPRANGGSGVLWVILKS